MATIDATRSRDHDRGPDSVDVVRCRRFELEDDNGTTRLVIEADPLEEGVAVTLLNAKGEEMAQVWDFPDRLQEFTDLIGAFATLIGHTYGPLPKEDVAFLFDIHPTDNKAVAS